MSIGTSEVRETQGRAFAYTVEQTAAPSEIEQRYELLREAILQEGSRLFSTPVPMGELAAWEADYARYRQDLQEMQRLSQQLRPRLLRSRDEILVGGELVDEIVELFAA